MPKYPALRLAGSLGFEVGDTRRPGTPASLVHELRTPMTQEMILQEAHRAGLTPLVTRIALALVRIEGTERAQAFIRDIRGAGLLLALRRIEEYDILHQESRLAV